MSLGRFAKLIWKLDMKRQTDTQTFTILDQATIVLPFVVDFGGVARSLGQLQMRLDFLTEILNQVAGVDVAFSWISMREKQAIIYSRGTYRKAMRLWKSNEICWIRY